MSRDYVLRYATGDVLLRYYVPTASGLHWFFLPRGFLFSHAAFFMSAIIASVIVSFSSRPIPLVFPLQFAEILEKRNKSRAHIAASNSVDATLSLRVYLIRRRALFGLCIHEKQGKILY